MIHAMQFAEISMHEKLLYTKEKGKEIKSWNYVIFDIRYSLFCVFTRR